MSEIYLIHHGILGQKWGIRRFQNKDGTRTTAGKKRENNRDNNESDKEQRKGFIEVIDKIMNEKNYKDVTKEFEELF